MYFKCSPKVRRSFRHLASRPTSLRVPRVPLQGQQVPELVFLPGKPKNSLKNFQLPLTSPKQPRTPRRWPAIFSSCRSSSPSSCRREGYWSFAKLLKLRQICERVEDRDVRVCEPNQRKSKFLQVAWAAWETQRHHVNGLGTTPVARTPISPERQRDEMTVRAPLAVLHVFTREQIQVDIAVQHVMRRTARQGCHQLMRKPHGDAQDLFFVRLRVVDPRLRCVRAWPQTVTQEFRSEVSVRIFASTSHRQALPFERTTILNSAYQLHPPTVPLPAKLKMRSTQRDQLPLRL